MMRERVDARQLVVRIREEMVLRRVTIEDVARLAQVSRVTIWRLLTERTGRPRWHTAKKIGKALGLSEEGTREEFSGQYELLAVIDRLPQDDELFERALKNQLQAVPESLRLAAVRAAMIAMAGVMHHSSDEPVVKSAYVAVRDLELARWRARRDRHGRTASPGEADLREHI